MRIAFYKIMFICITSFLMNDVVAQTLESDLSRGSYLLLQKPFQIEAMGFPHRFDDQTNTTKKMQWDLETFKMSNYTSHLVSVWNLDWWPVGAGDLPWSKVEQADKEGFPIPLTATERSKFKNIVRVQWEDDNLHPALPEMVEIAERWFKDRLANADYKDIVLSIDLPPYGYSSDQLDDMLKALQPDLIMWNRYPQEWSQKLHLRQIEYGWYAMLVYNRDVAQGGNDRTGRKPVPHGAYTQAFRNGYADAMPHSRMYYNHFLNLLFGAKYLSTFLYTSWPVWNAEEHDINDRDPKLNPENAGLVSTLFNSKYPFQPTAEFYVQKEINRQVSNIGNALLRLQTSGIRFVRGSNIEAVVQKMPFAGGIYDWDYGERPDPLLTKVSVTRPGFNDTQDVWVGWFRPIHETIDGSGTKNENYFMVVNGCWDANDVSSEQVIKLEFDFGDDDTINSLLRISRLTGEIEIVPLINITENRYCLDLVLNGGSGDLFKYNNGISFLGIENNE
ncbi:hypothetical protein ACOCEA_07060 [Maribacter sp. CXY002]|uniref:hypothetical protein n=1 Tax=Maribacter luteocoastalis TaxID=3407671 RepID=UPI003B67B88A